MLGLTTALLILLSFTVTSQYLKLQENLMTRKTVIFSKGERLLKFLSCPLR